MASGADRQINPCTSLADAGFTPAPSGAGVVASSSQNAAAARALASACRDAHCARARASALKRERCRHSNHCARGIGSTVEIAAATAAHMRVGYSPAGTALLAPSPS